MSAELPSPGPTTRPGLPGLLAELARRPLALFAWLAALNALALPYLGYVHDARLYSGQVLQKLDPEFWGRDLFFRFGSQDRFSAFSRITAPLTAAVGLDAAFFLLYLASVALFLSGLQRLVLRLWPDSPGAVAGLFYAVLIPLPYGGLHIFHVLEPFTTPRLAASGLTLWGLAFALDRRWLAAVVALLGGLALHPLMAFPGVVLTLGLALWQVGGLRLLAAGVVTGLAGLAALFAVPGLALRLFGHLDEEWKFAVRHCSAYHFPEVWPLQNWVWAIAGIVAVAAAARLVAPRVSAARFLWLAAGLGFAGLVGSNLVSRGSYALLVQGQPYRALWLTTALLPSAAFALAWHAWQSGHWQGRLGALAIVVGLGITADPVDQMLWVFFALPVALMLVRRPTAPAERATAVLACAVVLGFVLWGVYRLTGFLLVARPHLPTMEPLLHYELALGALGPGVLVTAALLAVWWFGRRAASAPVAVGLGVLAVGWQVMFLVLPHVAPDGTVDDSRAGVRFVKDYLERHRDGRALTVYSDLGQLNRVWLDWGARSYYDPCQTAGAVFARATAVEAQRRALLAGPFEMARMRARWPIVPGWLREDLQTFLRVRHDDPAPTQADLLRLMHDEELDYVVLWHAPELGDLADASGPGVLIFDTRRLRATAGR